MLDSYMGELTAVIMNTPCIFCGQEFVNVSGRDTYMGKETLFSHIERAHSAELEDRYNAAYYESLSYEAAKERAGL